MAPERAKYPRILYRGIERPSRFTGLIQEPLVHRVRDVPRG